MRKETFLIQFQTKFLPPIVTRFVSLHLYVVDVKKLDLSYVPPVHYQVAQPVQPVQPAQPVGLPTYSSVSLVLSVFSVFFHKSFVIFFSNFNNYKQVKINVVIYSTSQYKNRLILGTAMAQLSSQWQIALPQINKCWSYLINLAANSTTRNLMIG